MYAIRSYYGQVHALMPAILLGVAWLDAFDGNAEPQPPDREFREIVEPIGTGKGHAVIRTYGIGQATCPEQGMEGFDDGGFLCALQGLTGQDEARGMVGDRQGVTVGLVAKTELPLEVDVV